MQEFLIILSLVLGLFFLIFATKSNSWPMFLASGIFFLLISVGLFSSGWERYEGDATITEISSTVTDVEQTTNYYSPTFNENATIWAFATICFAFGLSLLWSGARTYSFVKEINANNEEKE